MGKTEGSYRGINYWYEPNPYGEGWYYKSDASSDTTGITGGTEEELVTWIHTLICWKLKIPVWSRSTHGDWVLEENGKIHSRSNEPRRHGELPYHILPEHPTYEKLRTGTFF